MKYHQPDILYVYVDYLKKLQDKKRLILTFCQDTYFSNPQLMKLPQYFYPNHPQYAK